MLNKLTISNPLAEKSAASVCKASVRMSDRKLRSAKGQRMIREFEEGRAGPVESEDATPKSLSGAHGFGSWLRASFSLRGLFWIGYLVGHRSSSESATVLSLRRQIRNICAAGRLRIETGSGRQAAGSSAVASSCGWARRFLEHFDAVGSDPATKVPPEAVRHQPRLKLKVRSTRRYARRLARCRWRAAGSTLHVQPALRRYRAGWCRSLLFRTVKMQRCWSMHFASEAILSRRDAKWETALSTCRLGRL